jgi:nucleoid-associated protein YgaU
MWIRVLSVVTIVAFAAGCGLKAQTYVMQKPRVGIEKGSGNAGYLSGTPQFKETEKKTRQVYILEITKSIPETEAKKIEEESTLSTQTNIEREAPAPVAPASTQEERGSNKIVIPKIDDDAPSLAELQKLPQGPKEATTYTVQKDDTLQKIAKKHYGIYSAWIKIYEANKDKIKNPNFVKPGTVITLPAVE